MTRPPETPLSPAATATAIRSALLDAAASTLGHTTSPPADADAAADAAAALTAAALARLAALRAPLKLAVTATVHARTGGGQAVAAALAGDPWRDGGVSVAWEGGGGCGGHCDGVLGGGLRVGWFVAHV